MNKRQVEHGIICIWFLLAAFVLTTASPAARGQQRTEISDKPAEQVYENIEIFKGQPAANVMRAMVSWTRLLGVDCTYCHVNDRWEKDDKQEKQTARKMFRMVDLVNKYLESNQVTCYTCHRGKPKPANMPEAARKQ